MSSGKFRPPPPRLEDRRGSYERPYPYRERDNIRFHGGRSPRRERSPPDYQHGRHANSSPTDSTGRRGGLLPRRPSNESSSRGQERPVGGGSDTAVDNVVNHIYGAYLLLADRALLKFRKQELERQGNVLSAEAKTIAEGRFEEYPSARELHAKRSERHEQDLKKVNSEIDVNKTNLGKSAKSFVESFLKLPGASSEVTVHHYEKQPQPGQDALERKVNAQLAAFENRLKEQQGLIEEQSRTITTLQSQQTVLQAHVDDLKAENERIKAENERIKAENERIKAAVETHTTAIKPGDSSQGMEHQLSDLKDSMHKMRVDLDNLDMDMIEEAVQVKECDLPALKSRVDKLENKAASAGAAGELPIKIKQLEAALNQVRAASPGAVGQLQAQMMTSMERFSDQFSTLVDELDARVSAIEARTLRPGLPGDGLVSQEAGEADGGDTSDRDAILDALRREQSQGGTPVPVPAGSSTTDVAEVKSELLSLRAAYQGLQSAQGTLEHGVGDFRDTTRETINRHDQVLTAVQHAVAALSQQFNNITTDDMCKKIFEHVLSMRSMDDQGRRIDLLERRTHALEVSRPQPLVNGSDTANKKRKASSQADFVNGQH